MGSRAPWIMMLLIVLLSGWALAGDMLRKSIVFDKRTPEVFYCPWEKPTGMDKMLVHARPLSKLCEHGGGSSPLPPDYKSDCYNDVDESDFACKEKKRIMMRLKSDKEGEESEKKHPK